ncbi:MAG: GAF domain-containing protein [Ignavibacteriales bacterium]|nr:GAF domain-containing protein [Ignavibacteriales bacterium]
MRFRSSAMRSAQGQEEGSPSLLKWRSVRGWSGEAAADGRADRLVDDVQTDARYRFIDSLPETQSEVVIPLKIEDRVLGVLDVQSDQVNAFHPNDLLILNALADNDRTRRGRRALVQRPAPPRQPVDLDLGSEQERQFVA